MIEIEEKAASVYVDVKGGEVTANITPADNISVTVGESAVMDATAAINYVKSGEAEINRYVNNVSKPEIDRYVEDTAEPLVAQIIEEQAEPVINAYVDNEVIPNINSVAESTLTAFNNNASAKTTAFNDNASAKTTAFDNNAASAIATIEPLVTTATSAATAASTSATNAATSASNASSSASDALSAKNAAVAAKDAAESAATDVNVVAVGTDLRASSSKIKTVANNITDVNTVANSISNVNSVAGNISNVNAVAGNATNINAVNTNKNNINTVAGISSDVSTVAGIALDITDVVAISSDISTVASNAANVRTVANNDTNISTVATNISDVNTVATNTSNIATVVANITDIQNASSNAQKAKDWAVKMNGLVDGEDYSAKYYAQQAQQAASDVSNKANKDLSNLSSTGEARFMAKQNTLESGTNIKTINGQSVLGSGDLTVTASTAWGSITGTLSAQTDLQNALNAKQDTITDLTTIRSGASAGATAVQPADLATVATSGDYADLSGTPNMANYVTTNTTQTITGEKIIANNANPNFIIQNTQYAYNDSQSANAYWGINFQDKNGRRVGKVEPYYVGSGAIGMNLSVSTVVNGKISYGALTVEIDANGQATTKASTPTETTTTTGKQIATTGWVNSTNNNVVHKTGSETISGAKTFADSALTVWAQLPELNLADSDVQKGTVPSRWNQGSILYKDKDFNDLVAICPRYTPAKETRLEFICYAAQAASNTGYESMVLYGGTSGQGGDGSLTVPSTYPNGTDNTKDLGKSWARWKQLYAGTTSINTSDERVKQGIEPLPDDVLDAWGEVEFYRYKFNDAVEEKGFAKARYHTGMVAQRIERVFAEHGLNAFEYGLLCYDEWEAVEEEKDESGEIVRPARAAGNRYSLRYEECLCMEAAYQRRRADRIEARLAALEARL